MKPAIVEQGHRYRLRLAEVDDAAAILALRLDAENKRFIHSTSPDLDDQRRWLSSKIADDTDFTFVLEELATSDVRGAFSVYDLDRTKGCARYGRWLTSPADRGCVAEFALLGFTVIFDRLDLDQVFARIPEGHKSAHAFQDRIGAERHECAHRSDLERGSHPLVEYRVGRGHWPSIQRSLLPLVAARDRAHRAPVRP